MTKFSMEKRGNFGYAISRMIGRSACGTGGKNENLQSEGLQ